MQEFVGGREKLIFSTMTLFQSQFTLTESIGVWPSFTCETKQSDTTIRWAVQTDQFYMHLGFTCKRNREIKDKSRWTQANGPLKMWRIVHNSTINATAGCLAAWSLNSFAVVQRFPLDNTTCLTFEARWFMKYQLGSWCSDTEHFSSNTRMETTFSRCFFINFCRNVIKRRSFFYLT